MIYWWDWGYKKMVDYSKQILLWLSELTKAKMITAKERSEILRRHKDHVRKTNRRNS